MAEEQQPQKQSEYQADTPLVDASKALNFAGDISAHAGWVLKRLRAYPGLFIRVYTMRRVRRYLRHFQGDLWYQAEVTTKISALTNIFFVIYQGYNAYARHSFWFAVLAVYHFMLMWLRVVIVDYMGMNAADGREELRQYRRVGILLLLLTTIVLSMGIVANRVGHRPTYPGHMIFVVGAFTLYNVFNSVRNLRKYQQLETPIISASKALNLATVLVSIYQLQCATIGWFDRTGWISTALGILTPLLILGGIAAISITMIVRSTRALNSV